MLPGLSVPPSLERLLAGLRPCFTAPSFVTFCALVCGMLAQTGRRTVCGMLTGAGLSGVWSHHRAHKFFSAARWSPEDLGVLLAQLVVRLLLPADAPVGVVIDDTLFTRTGKKVWAAGWFHDGSAKGPKQVGYGNNWVILGILVSLPMLDRPVCLPVAARLVRKDTVSGSRLWLARGMVTALAQALPGRRIHVVTDALLRESETSRGYDLALVTTDPHATAGQIVERYATRWAVEVAIQDAKQLAGVGQAHNRKPRAVERTVPFGLACLTLAVCWYATTGHQPDDVTEHRAHRPWYRTKTNPSTADMLTKLRRVLIATRFRPARPEQPTQAEIQTIRLAWEDPAA